MKLVTLLVVCAVITIVYSEKYQRGPYGPYMQGYTRIKRVKYSSPPQRFYSRPPANFPSVGTFSYTPPPGYMENEEPFPGNFPGIQGNPRPKVSRRPSEGLGEEDLQNFAKYLSKQDLDKILEYAGHRDIEKSRDYRPSDGLSNIDGIQDTESPRQIEDSQIFNTLVKEIDVDPKYNNFEAKYPDVQLLKSKNIYNSSPNLHTEPKSYDNPYQDKRFNEYQSQPINTDPQIVPSAAQDQEIENNLSDSKITEEILPRPLNLRDDDYEVSFTHNIPSVLDAESNYKVENFGALPLMNYNSKLDKLSSYHVPHYTVTSSQSISSKLKPSYSAPSSSSSSSSVSVEPAPPPSAAREQSDAHLKAVRIWSHRSKGTAYTLHDDGTLSLERPGKPKYGY